MTRSIRLEAALVHEIIREEGEEGPARSIGAPACSGLAADASRGPGRRGLVGCDARCAGAVTEPGEPPVPGTVEAAWT